MIQLIKINPIYFLLLITQFWSCGVVYKNIVSDEFYNIKPKSIGIFISKKSILERPSSTNHYFSLNSLFPDTLDQGSSLGFRNNSTDEIFLKENQINNLFGKVLKQKKYNLYTINLSSMQSLPIRNIISRINKNEENRLDVALFIDYSPMFNKYFSSKGITGNNGYSCYYRFGLFDLKTGNTLIKYRNVLHMDFYFRNNPTNEEMANDILKLMEEDLLNNFPNAVF